MHISLALELICLADRAFMVSAVNTWNGRGQPMNEAIRLEIEALRTLKTKALKERYRELFGEHSPSSNHAHLFRRVAWRLQANATGGLTEEARGRAAELAVDAGLRLRAPRQFWQELDGGEKGSENLPRDRRLPPAGTELTRTYQGRLVRVIVLKQGFEYKGKRYDSLSAIGSRVTGTRWNGFCFFGLREEIGND
jgi:hypothetical protein